MLAGLISLRQHLQSALGKVSQRAVLVSCLPQAALQSSSAELQLPTLHFAQLTSLRQLKISSQSTAGAVGELKPVHHCYRCKASETLQFKCLVSSCVPHQILLLVSRFGLSSKECLSELQPRTASYHMLSNTGACSAESHVRQLPLLEQHLPVAFQKSLRGQSCHLRMLSCNAFAGHNALVHTPTVAPLLTIAHQQSHPFSSAASAHLQKTAWYSCQQHTGWRASGSSSCSHAVWKPQCLQQHRTLQVSPTLLYHQRKRFLAN